MRSSLLALLLLPGLALAGPSLDAPTTSSPAPAPREPWRLADSLPDLVRVNLDHRTRVEAVSGSFRRPGDDLGLFLRTVLGLQIGTPAASLIVEGMDARRYGSGEATANNTGLVNPVDLLMARVRLRGQDVFRDGDRVTVSLGRTTLDVGSRRLIARNRYRNTINAFTGAAGKWEGDRAELGAFILVPVQRLPDDAAELDANRPQLDREALGTWFFGVAGFGSDLLGHGARLDVLGLGLIESDTDALQTRDRRLGTLSARLYRGSAEGRVHYDVELVGQGGRSRASATATEDLAHLAGFAHLALGYTVPGDLGLRGRLSVDLASGDADPDDGSNQRFDTLFGARRFAYGPTGIWGAFARSNLISPEVRTGVVPHRRVRAFVAWRPAWLASATDAWVGTPLRDPAGQSGRFLGQQVEGRLRWEALPRNLRLEAGAAALVRGAFARSAPGAPSGVVSGLGYCQVVVWI